MSLAACVYVCGHTCDLRGGQRTTCGSILSFYRVGPGDGTQVARLGVKALFLLSHLNGLNFFSKSYFVFSYESVCMWKSVHMNAVPMEARSVRPSGARVMGSCELLDLGTKLGLQQEPHGSLTAEPSLMLSF